MIPHRRSRGSPPRVRGKVFGQNFQYFPSGITPACAGKRKQEHGQKNRSGDHPRVCGEKLLFQMMLFVLRGSPPRMRGKVVHKALILLRRGITPACAGKSSAARRARQPSRDHPRVCGEKTEYRALVTAHQGSPPRMRGKVDLSLKVVRVLGITPACAGKSCPFLRRTSPRRDHPRVCGEKGRQLVK